MRTESMSRSTLLKANLSIGLGIGLLIAPGAFATNQIKLQVTPRNAQVREKITLRATVTIDGLPATAAQAIP